MSTPLDTDDLIAFDAPISTDVDEIRDEIHAAIRELIPGWEPLPTHPMTHLAGALATLTADSRAAVKARLRSTLLDLLGTLFRIPRGDGAPAESTLTIRARDTNGHAASAPIAASIGDIELEVPVDVVIPAGQDTVAVPVVAVAFGTAPNGADGPVDFTAFDWIAEVGGVALDAPLAGGEDPEEDDPYAVRMAEELQTMSTTLILPRDYSIAARRHPAVGFAWTLPHHNGDTGDDAAPFHVTTWITNTLGGDVSSGAFNAVKAQLQAQLLDNVVHHLRNATLRPIDVTLTVVRRLGWDPAAVATGARQHMEAVLSPAAFASPRWGDDANPIPSRVVHKNELIARADEPDGTDYVKDLRIGDGTSPMVTLGVGELPTPGTITVQVVDG